MIKPHYKPYYLANKGGNSSYLPCLKAVCMQSHLSAWIITVLLSQSLPTI